MSDAEKIRRLEQDLVAAENDATRRQENVDRLRAELAQLRDDSEFDARHRVLDACYAFQDGPTARAARTLAAAATAYAAQTLPEGE